MGEALTDGTGADQRTHSAPALATAPPRAEERPPPPQGSQFRTDIQALRAIAVLAVVVNHLWPDQLTGGYVGVDVFFVISGFLITGHLSRELVDTGRVRLGRFYARRIRRLLPAAFLVLGFCIVAAYFLLPYPQWAETAQHVIASALYGENWLLAAESVDYSALDTAASLTQHYWSLSVEEQFYLVWPVLLLLCFKFRRSAVATVVGASLVYCVYVTMTSPSPAYFVTPARMWEFGIGALIALTAVRLPARAAFVGLALIVGSAFFYDHGTPFPGYFALIPTVGTALVIMAGWRTTFRPVQWLGDVSYSLYLWHWPLILLAPFALGNTLTWQDKLGVLAVALVLSALTKKLVEDPGRALTRRTGLTFAAMAAGLVALAVAAGTLVWTYDRHVEQAKRETPPPVAACHGAAAMEPGCPDPFGPAPVTTMGPANLYYQLPPECRELDEHMVNDDKTVRVCDFSGGAKNPEIVWVIGDSHAAQWHGPLVDLAREHKWVFKSAILGGCPITNANVVGYRGPASDGARQVCMNWNREVVPDIAADNPARVFVAFFSRREFIDDGTGRPAADQYRDGLAPFVRTWTDAGAKVTVLADPPLGEVRPPDCMALHPDEPLKCAMDRSVAQPPDPLVEGAREIPDAQVIDLTKYFCDERLCYSVVGKVTVYYDANHMNRDYARTLTPMLAAELGYR